MLALAYFVGTIAASRAKQYLSPSSQALAKKETEEKIELELKSGKDTLAIAQEDDNGLVQVTVVNLADLLVNPAGQTEFSRLWRSLNFNMNTVIVLGDASQINRYTDDIMNSNTKGTTSLLEYSEKLVTTLRASKPRKTNSSSLSYSSLLHAPALRSTIASTISSRLFQDPLPKVNPRRQTLEPSISAMNTPTTNLILGRDKMFAILPFIGSIAVTRGLSLVNKQRFLSSSPDIAQEQIVAAIESGQNNIAVAQSNNDGLIDVTIIDIPAFLRQSGAAALNTFFRGLNFNSNMAFVMGNKAQVQDFANNLSLFNPKKWGSALAYIENLVSSTKPPQRRKAIKPADLGNDIYAINPARTAAIAQTLFERIFNQLPNQLGNNTLASLDDSQRISNASTQHIMASHIEEQSEGLDPAYNPFLAHDFAQANGNDSLESAEARDGLSETTTKPKRTRRTITNVPITIFEAKHHARRATTTASSDNEHALSLDEHVTELTQLIDSMLLFSTSSPKLKPKHRDAINTCVRGLRDATEAFMHAPSPATFAAFQDISVTKIKAMETLLAHQPMIWKLLKRICNQFIRVMNAIKIMIWTTPNMHSLFNSKSEAQLAWEATRRRPMIMHQLEQIRRVVAGDEAPIANPILGGSSQ